MPKIFNTNQGSQFTSTAFTGVLVAAGNAISIEGRGRWMDNVIIERPWRSLKHEDIYLKGYAYGGEARAGHVAQACRPRLASSRYCLAFRFAPKNAPKFHFGEFWPDQHRASKIIIND